MSPGLIGRNYIRNLYMIAFPGDVSKDTASAEMAPALLVGRMFVPEEIEAQFNQVYNLDRLPLYHSIPGYIRARRFVAVEGEPKYITVHECETPEVADSPEWGVIRDTITPLGPTQSYPKWPMPKVHPEFTSASSLLKLSQLNGASRLSLNQEIPSYDSAGRVWRARSERIVECGRLILAACQSVFQTNVAQ